MTVCGGLHVTALLMRNIWFRVRSVATPGPLMLPAQEHIHSPSRCLIGVALIAVRGAVYDFIRVVCRFKKRERGMF